MIDCPSALACDNCSAALPIGFSFPFYAEEFTNVHVSSNGMLSLSLITGAGGGTSGVYALLQGNAPHRRLTIEWKGVPHASGAGTITFEVTLFETSGQIHFRYKDLIFGTPSLDGGASAVVGVENRTGAHGVAYSCNDSHPLTGITLVRFLPTTAIFEEHGELTPALWTPTGQWHNSTNTCEPDQHAGSRGWYYGSSATCGYSNGLAGSLLAPTVIDFPADTRMSFWSRLGTQPGVDLAQVQLSTSGTAGPYTTVQNVADNLMTWKYPGVTNLFSNAGDTVDLRHTFTADGSFSSLGWMVDDIQLVGCDATGVSSIAQAMAYTPSLLCEGSRAVADALGSFCGDGSDPARFQWYEDGAVISGADAEMLTIGETLLPGGYDYSVEITCENGAMAASDPATVSVSPPPAPVSQSLTLTMEPGGTAPTLVFTREESPGSDDYVVLQDTAAIGDFTTVVGTTTAAAGSTLSVPMPPGDLLFFLVAGRNQACGVGPIR